MKLGVVRGSVKLTKYIPVQWAFPPDYVVFLLFNENHCTALILDSRHISETHISFDRLYPSYPTADFSLHHKSGNREDIKGMTVHQIHLCFYTCRVKADGCSGNAHGNMVTTLLGGCVLLSD